jgi:RHS repeat-associated protein
LNQLKTLANGNITESFNYDDNGNLLETKLNNSSVTKFEYDIRNQLSKYTGVGNGINVTFDYDFERKRTSKTSSNVTTNYTYAGNQVVNETNNNVISASYTIGGGEIIKSEFVANGESNYHFTDALGSVTSLTNNQGSLTSRSDYDAFGLQTGNGSSNSIGYTGQRLDSETGLMALGNGERYYSPSYARFIQQDSFAGSLNSPASMNRFSYAHNNPNKYTDPSGNIVFVPILAAMAVGALILLAVNAYSDTVKHDLARAEGREQDNGSSTWKLGLSDAFGMTQLVNGLSGADSYNGKEITGLSRAWDIGAGAVQVMLNATVVGGAIFKAGSAGISLLKGGTVAIAEVASGAWGSAKGILGEIKDFKPFVEDVKGVISKVRNPIDTVKSAWNGAKETAGAGWQATKEYFKDGVGQTAKQKVKQAWEFTKERLNPFNYKRDGANIKFATKGEGTARAVNSAGRQSADNILNDDQIAFVKNEFDTIGGDIEMLRFNHGKYTGYVDEVDKINIRGDVFPNVLSNNPNSAMSVRAALAHELGHQNFKGTSLAQGSWNDEFRASYWASKNVPNLSVEDKYMLVSDAVQRVREAAPIVPITLNKYIKETLYGK